MPKPARPRHRRRPDDPIQLKQVLHQLKHLVHHDHDSSLPVAEAIRRLQLGLVVNLVFGTVEAVAGALHGSVVLMLDATHMAADAIMLVFALLALRYAGRGSRYAEALGTAMGALLLIVSALFNSLHAVELVLEGGSGTGGGVRIVLGLTGMAVNVLVLVLVHPVAPHSDTGGMAQLHAVLDFAGSAGATLAGVLIDRFGWQLADPIAAGFVALLMLGYGAARGWPKVVEIVLEQKSRFPADGADAIEARLMAAGVPVKSTIALTHVSGEPRALVSGVIGAPLPTPLADALSEQYTLALVVR